MICTRFAPSPAGFLHPGVARTALFGYLFSKSQSGKFILRIEDTDKNRQVEGAEDHIINSLKWLGINWDEGVVVGGENAPYRQSERLEIYKSWAEKLIEKGLAYADPYTIEQLQEFREKATAEKKPFLYRNHRPENPPKWDGSQPLRLKSMPMRHTWHDEVMGELSAGEEAVDDFILIKADGYPTYNFCHIIDDMLMGVTHIIRSQEFISSVPKFLDLYRALEITPPIFVTVPFVMAMEGGKKLSKRDGAKDLLQYKNEGYLPEAMINFLATLGWNDGTEKEIFSVDDLIGCFDVRGIQPSPARFDYKRLEWINGQWIRTLNIEQLMDRAEDFWQSPTNESNRPKRLQVLALIQDRLRTLADIPKLSAAFFEEPDIDISMIDQDKKLRSIDKNDLAKLLSLTIERIGTLPDEMSADLVQETLNNLLSKSETKPAVLFSLIRYCLTWQPFSPGLAETIQVLGKQTTINRLEKAKLALS